MTDTTVQSKASPVAGSIADVRREVISGNWQAINNGDYTLTGLGLRHNGNGLFWLRSGVSVHECDHDEGFSGKEKASSEYHEGVCPARSAHGAGFSRGVHSHKVDSYCLHILTSSPSWVEYWHRSDGKALTTFAVQVLTSERQEAFDGWVIYRHPEQMDKYTVVHKERDRYLIQEYVKRGWKCESTYELSLLVKNDAGFGRLMTRLGYIKVRTRKITGKKETFWLYRSAEKGLMAADRQPGVDASYSAVVRRVSRGNQEVCPQEPAPRKASAPVVQMMTKPHPWFKRVALDGKWQHVYADHLRLLTKKRHRVDGVRVQGYTAKNVNLVTEDHPDSEVCPQNAQNSRELMVFVQAAQTQYTAGVLSTMTPQDILSAAKNTLMQISTTHGFGMMAHNIMLSHGGRNLVSVPPSNLANCLVELDKLRVIAGKGNVEVIA